MHLRAVPAGKADHDRLHARTYGGKVRRAEDVAQAAFIDPRVTLILATRGSAIAQEMLGGGYDVRTTQPVIITELALQAFNQRSCIRRCNIRCLAKAFVSPAPAIVPHHGKCGCEGPIEASDAHFDRGYFPDTPHQIRVVGGPEPDIVRKQRSTYDVIVTVNGVAAPDYRNSGEIALRLHRGGIIGIGCLQPFRSRRVVLTCRRRIATIEDRSEVIAANVFGCGARDVSLNDLPDFLFKRHSGD